jgi:hypothetical protein
MYSFRFLLFLLLLATGHTALGAGDRLLFENPDYDVTMAEDYFCDEIVAVTVHSNLPSLFEADSPELQRIVDGAQAVLAFECPEFHSIRIEGRLSGIDAPVYSGMAERRSGWRLAASQSIQSKQYDEYAAPMDDGDYGDWDWQSGFTVAGLSAGMSVDDAQDAVRETFGVESEFDIEDGILTMQAGGCPWDYDWAALSPAPERGWKCLSAWFTDQRLARLYLLDLVQVIDAADPELVAQQLIDRYGEPVYRETRDRDGSWWGDKETIHVLAWGAVVEAPEAGGDDAGEVYTLQAKILPIDDVTVVTVTLYEPGIRPGRASDPGSSVPDLTL